MVRHKHIGIAEKINPKRNSYMILFLETRTPEKPRYDSLEYYCGATTDTQVSNKLIRLLNEEWDVVIRKGFAPAKFHFYNYSVLSIVDEAIKIPKLLYETQRMIYRRIRPSTRPTKEERRFAVVDAHARCFGHRAEYDTDGKIIVP